MKVFISWSGEASRQAAWALRDWLPMVLQTIEPWLSSEDIPTGTRWATEIASALEETDIGIVCLTKENLNSPWINFEAGALSKIQHGSSVSIYAVGIDKTEIKWPLAQFQATSANREETFDLIETLNSKSEFKINGERLHRIFELYWPELETRLSAITTATSDSSETKNLPINAKLDEIISLLRTHLVAQSTDTNVLPSHSDKVPSSLLEEQRPHRLQKTPTAKPRVFIGSSVEGLSIARALQLNLEHDAESTIWNQSVFDPSKTVIESIVEAAIEFDFAILVLTPDDIVFTRGKVGAVPRDNILFELGLFTGALGRSRTFLVYPDGENVHLPSDLAGVIGVTYLSRLDDNLPAALGPVSERIRKAMGLVGVKGESK